jgi:peroxiredoxin
MLKAGFALSILILCSLGSILVAQGPIFVGPGPRTAREHKVKLLPVGEPAPSWELGDQEGKIHSLAEYRGKVVVMEFWATWCGPCAEVMPRMQKLHEKFADKGVVVLGVNSWEENDPIALMQKKRFSYRLLLKGERLAEAYKVTMLPVVYIIGDDGTIIYCHGGVDDKNLSSLIQKYIGGRRIT